MTPEVRKLVVYGDPERLLKACSSCHGRDGRGGQFDHPAISGQIKTYLIDTMLAFKEGDRTNDIYSRMRYVAEALTEDEIEALAEYYASDLPEEEEDDDEDEDENLGPTQVSGDTVTISWDPVTTSHPTIGLSGDIEVELYQVVVEVELKVDGDESVSVFSVDLPPDVTAMTVPEQFIALGDGFFKYEVLVREKTGGNQTAASKLLGISQQALSKRLRPKP